MSYGDPIHPLSWILIKIQAKEEGGIIFFMLPSLLTLIFFVYAYIL